MTIQIPELKEMLDAGMHFGHKKERSHPGAKQFIFGIRDGINIIDLNKTQDMAKLAGEFLQKEAVKGKTILFVGTKKRVKDLIKNAAINCQMPYIVDRWLGGTLTNFETVRKGISALKDAERILADADSDLTKKEKTVLKKRLEKLKKTYEGVRDLHGLPDILFVFDAANEKIAVKEAKAKNIPVVAVCDTDANPQLVDWVIPANDDAINSMRMVIKMVEDAICEAKESKNTAQDSKIDQEESADKVSQSINEEKISEDLEKELKEMSKEVIEESDEK